MTTTLHDTTGTAAPARRRAATAALWALQALLALVYLASAGPKLTRQPEAVAGFADLGFSATGMVVIGGLELAGAVALLVPRLCGLAALAFVGLMAGAVALTVLRLDPADAVLPGTLLVLAAIVAWARRGRTAALADLVRR
jgi:uncharacterized membrane protein YphA (DoxX/SURF4 family)